MNHRDRFLIMVFVGGNQTTNSLDWLFFFLLYQQIVHLLMCNEQVFADMLVTTILGDTVSICVNGLLC